MGIARRHGLHAPTNHTAFQEPPFFVLQALPRFSEDSVVPAFATCFSHFRHAGSPNEGLSSPKKPLSTLKIHSRSYGEERLSFDHKTAQDVEPPPREAWRAKRDCRC